MTEHKIEIKNDGNISDKNSDTLPVINRRKSSEEISGTPKRRHSLCSNNEKGKNSNKNKIGENFKSPEKNNITTRRQSIGAANRNQKENEDSDLSFKSLSMEKETNQVSGNEKIEIGTRSSNRRKSFQIIRRRLGESYDDSQSFEVTNDHKKDVCHLKIDCVNTTSSEQNDVNNLLGSQSNNIVNNDKCSLHENESVTDSTTTCKINCDSEIKDKHGNSSNTVINNKEPGSNKNNSPLKNIELDIEDLSELKDKNLSPQNPSTKRSIDSSNDEVDIQVSNRTDVVSGSKIIKSPVKLLEAQSRRKSCDKVIDTAASKKNTSDDKSGISSEEIVDSQPGSPNTRKYDSDDESGITCVKGLKRKRSLSNDLNDVKNAPTDACGLGNLNEDSDSIESKTDELTEKKENLECKDISMKECIKKGGIKDGGENEEKTTLDVIENLPKRKRGRPRKFESSNDSVESPYLSSDDDESRSRSNSSRTSSKKGRGRPRKYLSDDDSSTRSPSSKRGRGRPKKSKDIINDEDNKRPKRGIKRKRTYSSDVESISSDSSESQDEELNFIEENIRRSVRKSFRKNFDSQDSFLQSKPDVKKIDESQRKSPPKITGDKDVFCWQCHREGNTLLICHTCPRVYHKRCAKISTQPDTWICMECNSAMVAGSFHNRSETLSLPQDRLNKLLKFAMERIHGHEGSQYFKYPVDLNEYPRYREYVINPMDLSLIEKNINNSKYKNTDSFLADLKWLVHNSYVFNTSYSELTTYARALMKIGKQEAEEIETCPNCYFHYHTMEDDSWFIEPCEKPHLLVWAKLRGFPHWPAKIMRIVDDLVDVRFFGDHNRSWLPPDACYLFSKSPPFVSKGGNLSGYNDCIKEVFIHIKKLKDKFKEFCFAPVRIKYVPEEHNKMLSDMLPYLKPNKPENKVSPKLPSLKPEFKTVYNYVDIKINPANLSPSDLTLNTNKTTVYKNIIKPKKPDVVPMVSTKEPVITTDPPRKTESYNTKETISALEIKNTGCTESKNIDKTDNKEIKEVTDKSLDTVAEQQPNSEVMEEISEDNDVAFLSTDAMPSPVKLTKTPHVVLTRLSSDVIPSPIIEYIKEEKQDENVEENSKQVSTEETLKESEDKNKMEVQVPIEKLSEVETIRSKETPPSSERVMLKVKPSIELLSSEALKNINKDDKMSENQAEESREDVIDLSQNEESPCMRNEALKNITACIDTVAKGNFTCEIPSRKSKKKNTKRVPPIPSECISEELSEIEISDDDDEIESGGQNINETVTNPDLNELLKSCKNVSEISAWSLEPFVENETIVDSMNEIFQSIEQSNNLDDCKNLLMKFRKLALLQRDEMKSVYEKLKSEAQEVCETFLVEKQILFNEKNALACQKEDFAKKVKNIKLVQWCSSCLKEANFYCCWGTSYCSQECQLKDWDKHFEFCKQSDKDDNLRVANPNKNSASTSRILLPPSVTINKIGTVQKPESIKKSSPVLFSKQIGQSTLVPANNSIIIKKQPQMTKEVVISPKPAEVKPVYVNNVFPNSLKLAPKPDNQIILTPNQQTNRFVIKRNQLKSILGDSVSQTGFYKLPVFSPPPNNSNSSKIDNLFVLNNKKMTVSPNGQRIVVVRPANGPLKT